MSPPRAGVEAAGVAVNGASPAAVDKFIGDSTIEGILGHQEKMFGYSLIANGVNTLITNLAAWAANGKMWDAQMNINDRRMEAMENISADNRATSEKWIDFMDSANRRTDGPGGTRERVARIEANRDIEMYERRAQTQERLAAMRSLDTSFGLRSEYSYGAPYAYA